MRRPFRFVSNLKVALRPFRTRVGSLRVNSGFSFAVPTSRTCNRCSSSRIVSLPGRVFVVRKRFSDSHMIRNTIVPLVASRNRHVGKDMMRMGRSMIMVSVGRPLTNYSLGFAKRIIRDHPTAGRRLTRITHVVNNNYNDYNYNSYNSKYNSRRYKNKYYRWEVGGWEVGGWEVELRDVGRTT